MLVMLVIASQEVLLTNELPDLIIINEFLNYVTCINIVTKVMKNIFICYVNKKMYMESI